MVNGRALLVVNRLPFLTRMRHPRFA